MGNLHEVLPGISVFSNFYYIRTKEITYLNPSIEFSVKSYISMEILSFGIKILYKTSRDQTVEQRAEYNSAYVLVLPNSHDFCTRTRTRTMS